ncbi:MAG TPA: hypothetical protein VMG12_21870 [Polyangiaceae bacterium]|nr:hypothetical protein [Polyangiaceae bacterium]
MSRGLSGASWLLLGVVVACADADASPAYSYPFDPNGERPSTPPDNVVTTVSPNQPNDGTTDPSDLDGDEPGTDVNATGGAGGVPGTGGVGGSGTAGFGGVGGVGGVGGSPGQGLGGDGGFFGVDPDAADTAGFGGGGMGGLGGVGGAAGTGP